MSILILSDDKYNILMAEIKSFELKVPVYFYENLNDWGRQRCWNGAGADDTPKFARWLFTQLLYFMPCTIFIHDVACTYKRQASLFIDNDFIDNGHKELDCRMGTNIWNVERHYALILFSMANLAIEKFNKNWS